MQPDLLPHESCPHGDTPAMLCPGDSICAQVAAHAAAAPDRPAVVNGTDTLTYGELERQSNQLAGYLLEAGAGPERCLGLFLERSAQFVVAALAALKTGAAYLPLDSATPADRTAFILADAQAPLLLTHHGKTRNLPPGPWRVVEMDGPEAERIATHPATLGHVEPAPASLAYVIYTSGSTGRPKGVEITRANLANLIDWHVRAFGVTPADRASQVAGLGFDAAVWEIWPHLSAGASLHIADERTRRSPQALRDWLVAQGITISFAPTVLAEQLLHAAWPPGTALRILLTGADVLHRWPAAGLPFALVNNYGPTECTVVATSGRVAPQEPVLNSGEIEERTGPPSIGRPIADTTALILNEALRPVSAGEPGELCLAGALVGRGYRNNPELTAARFVTYVPESGPPLRVYRTGDRVRLLSDGEIAFLGRLDDQVKIRGYRIEPGEIVACLNRCPGVEASAVVVSRASGDGLTPQPPVPPRGEGEQDLIAYVVAAAGVRLLAADVRTFLAARLPDYMIPTAFVAVASLPATPNGKLDKSALPSPAADNLLRESVQNTGPDNPARAPAAGDSLANRLQHQIAALVASLLSRPSIDADENFFLSGGHSMLGVQLVSRIRQMFGVKLGLRQLFGAPTIAALAAEVVRLTGTSDPEKTVHESTGHLRS